MEAMKMRDAPVFQRITPLPTALRYPICALRDGDGVALPLPFLGVSSLDFGPLLREWPFLFSDRGLATARRQNSPQQSSGTGSLTARFPVMKYARSALATTVLAVFGLGVAVQNLHSHDRDGQVRSAAAAASLVTPVAWTDPPARRTTETTGTLASPSPVLLPTATPPAPASATAELPRRSTALHRGKGAERNRSRVARLHRSARAHTAAVDPAAMPQAAPQPASEASRRIDPIGDILRGLGFGRDS
ncbi:MULTISPECIES: hypothetical protein [unclassified Methylobacterium]|jgi:hypothetical protein|uniref:hypothetical protein n=1 Tax=unclassified Methylobacterium TaxID=2615210 RepID=UPI001FEF25FB|nr:hypothetical protein [Methylobacterium sp. 2A]